MNRKDYERISRSRESRINRIRIARALWEYISGQYASADRPTVQRLAQLLHYDAKQMITDIQDIYADTSDSCNYGALLDRITARYNAEVDQNHSSGQLDFIPDDATGSDIIRIALAEYALKHFPDALDDPEDD